MVKLVQNLLCRFCIFARRVLLVLKGFFEYDGPFFVFIGKLGQLIILTFLSVICSIFVITFGASMTALYYAVVKSVRRGRGSYLGEFFKAFKENLLKGSFLTLLFGAITTFAWFGRESIVSYLAGEVPMLGTAMIPEDPNLCVILIVVYIAIIAVCAFILVYLFPVLSRFSMSIGNVVKLAFVISVRYFYYTIALICVLAGMIYLQLFYLPLVTVIFIPGLYYYISSFITEKCMKKYTPEVTDPEVDAWWLED